MVYVYDLWDFDELTGVGEVGRLAVSHRIVEAVAVSGWQRRRAVYAFLIYCRLCCHCKKGPLPFNRHN
ncbi:hypothetical protein J6590_015169 [Homalodisca vitripennis]|nr:hypothetical protein J6590_015169 [Homalodisca vitripennis]